MSSLRVTVLGSSSTVGTNLSSPTTERYAALYQTHLRSARSVHCRVQIVATAGIGLYEQQATGFSTPANRVGAAPVNTSFNITTALAQKPQLLILHHPAGNQPEAIANWLFTTLSGLQTFNLEQLGLVQNIEALCRAASCEFLVMGSHPLLTSVLTQAEATAELNLARKDWNDLLAATYPGRFVNYFADIDDGTGQADSNKVLVDGRHCNTTGLTFVEAALEAKGFSTWQSRVTPLDIDP